MQKAILLITLLAVIVGSAYWYETRIAGCQLPLTYSIGEVDERFDLSREEALAAVSSAEAVWESAVDRELFSYVESGGDITINYTFDERQEFSKAQKEYKQDLDNAAAINEQVNQTYAEAVEQYRSLEAQYEADVTAYEERLEAFNETVERYNREGGAPPDEYEALQEERRALDDSAAKINATAERLNDLADRINQLSETGSTLVERYNENVQTYNDTFGESREFTQGDYRAGVITIYTFSDQEELITVLAHEFGHALGLDHVEGEASLMYYLLGGQPEDLMPSQADLDALRAQCDERGIIATIPVINKF